MSCSTHCKLTIGSGMHRLLLSQSSLLQLWSLRRSEGRNTVSKGERRQEMGVSTELLKINCGCVGRKLSGFRRQAAAQLGAGNSFCINIVLLNSPTAPAFVTCTKQIALHQYCQQLQQNSSSERQCTQAIEPAAQSSHQRALFDPLFQLLFSKKKGNAKHHGANKLFFNKYVLTVQKRKKITTNKSKKWK